MSHDGRGKIGGDVRGSETNTALYDAYGRLNSYAKTGASTWVMKYNGDDERVEVKIGTGTPRRFVYDEDGRLIGEYGNTVATINAEHVWLMPAANEGGYEPLALVGLMSGLTLRLMRTALSGKELAWRRGNCA